MHERNPYRNPVDFSSLCEKYPKLEPFLTKICGTDVLTIDFKNIEAQRCLTEALLWRDFGLKFSLPEGRLCPPVPNRLNYILWIQDILSESFQCLEKPYEIVGIDIGTGASAIYPLLGCEVDLSWKFVATEIDPVSYASAVQNVEQNKLAPRIRVSKVPSPDLILTPFQDEPNRTFTFTMCNPPFYADANDIQRSAEGKAIEPNSVCTGAEVEMITPGGEEAFVQRIIQESTSDDVRDRCLWFTSMVGKLSSIEKIIVMLRTYKIDNYALTELIQGQTRRWVVAWSFSDVRLPDNLARNLPSTHHALLPPHNDLQQVLPKSGFLDVGDIRYATLSTLTSLAGVTISELPEQYASLSTQNEEDSGMGETMSNASGDISLRVSAIQNSWSRAARRARKANASIVSDKPVIMTVDIFAVRKHLKREQCWVLKGLWRRGMDREMFESFWSHVSRKVASAVESRTADAPTGGV